MKGLMQDWPLLVHTVIDHAAQNHGEREVVSRTPAGPIERISYAEINLRARKLASALKARGYGDGDVIATMAWNGARHLESWYAIAGLGAVCHTLNPRLFEEQLVYIINHAGDRVLFVDPDLAPLLAPLVDRLETVERYVVMGSSADGSSLPDAIAYDELLDGAPAHGAWPVLDERSPMMLCYTSGTTGNPKGVAYSQRSTYLHTISTLADFAIWPTDNVLLVVPMFHAAAWGYPFAATTVGAKLTYPGPDLSAEVLVDLVADEAVTFSIGVPTVWLGIQQHLMANPDADMSSMRALLCGGAAVPRAMIEWFARERDIRVVQGWGMTETNPIASMALLKPEMETWDLERQLDVMESGGRVIAGLQVKIVDEEGNDLPHDGVAFGELLIRGPWVAAEYYKDPRTAETFVDGWMRTGDVCKITPSGYIRIIDRSKDVIKSGGEWISSLDLENILMAHPGVVEATVVGVKHAEWGERPVAFVVHVQGAEPTSEELLQFLDGKVAKWWLPDLIVRVDDIPKTGTGKFDKKVVRDQYRDLYL